MDHRFVIADVFSATPFGGNQLAVFPDAQGLSSRAMQALAREFNFAETTFVLPPDDPRHAARVRIFTPKAELPFAGHPTVGTAAVLAHLGRVDWSDPPHPASATARPSASPSLRNPLPPQAGGEGRFMATLVLEEGIGPVAVEVAPPRDGAALFARFALDQEIERPVQTPDPAHAAAALSLPEDAIVEAWFAGLGVRFAFVRLTDDKAVDRAALDRGAWVRHFASAWASNLYLFAGDVSPGSKLYVRMFAPALGIDEDPATGSGAGILAGCLAERVKGNDGMHAWWITQGIAMGRPSAIEAQAETRAGPAFGGRSIARAGARDAGDSSDSRATRAGRVIKIWVGGATVIMGEGTMRVPEGY